MYRFKSMKYFASTIMLISFLVVIGFGTSFIKFNSNAVFQITDGLYIALTIFIKGPMMFVVGIFYTPILDLIAGAPIYIPISIITKILMFVITKLLFKYLKIYVSFISLLPIFIYILYTYILYDESFLIIESIVDSIQYCVSVIVSLALSATLLKLNKNKAIWYDGEFDKYKNKRNIEASD